MEQDSANLKGFALVVVDMAKAINAALASRDKELFLAGFKATKPADASAAFELGPTGDFVAAGAPIVFNSNLGGRSWEIALTPSVKLIPTYTAKLVMAGFGDRNTRFHHCGGVSSRRARRRSA